MRLTAAICAVPAALFIFSASQVHAEQEKQSAVDNGNRPVFKAIEVAPSLSLAKTRAPGNGRAAVGPSAGNPAAELKLLNKSAAQSILPVSATATPTKARAEAAAVRAAKSTASTAATPAMKSPVSGKAAVKTPAKRKISLPARPSKRKPRVVASIDLSSQRMTVKVDGAVKHVWPISSGRSG